MRIRHLSVSNFRGIRTFDWPVPDGNALCLIGRGASTKSTILEAVRRVFQPQWNPSFDDAAFHLCDTTNSITIEAVLSDLPDAFRGLENYGHCLSGWNAEALARMDDPGDGHRRCAAYPIHSGRRSVSISRRTAAIADGSIKPSVSNLRSTAPRRRYSSGARQRSRDCPR